MIYTLSLVSQYFPMKITEYSDGVLPNLGKSASFYLHAEQL